MERDAILLALFTTFAWGWWAVMAKLAMRSLVPETAMFLTYVVGLAVTGAYALTRDASLTIVTTGTGFALGAGLCMGIGAIALYAALERGDAAAVTTVSALYFVVAAVLGAIVLGESLGWRDAAGVAFGVVAIVLLSS